MKWLAVIVLAFLGMLEFLVRAVMFLMLFVVIVDAGFVKPELWRIADRITGHP
jgi:hypothetical protein